MQCRVCRRLNYEELTALSSVVQTDGKTLYDYFNDCTQLKATPGDSLPQFICFNCTKNLKHAYDFRQEARRSDDELKRTLVLTKNEALLYLDPKQDTGAASSVSLLTGSQKRETEYILYPENFHTLDDIEAATVDVSSCTQISLQPHIPSSSMKKKLDDLNEITVPGTSDDNDASIVDPLSGYSGQRARKSLFIMSEGEHISNKSKGEILIELSNGIVEQTSKEQYDELMSKGHNINNDESKRNKVFACNICVYKSSKKSELKEHVFQLHKDTILCHECSKVFQLPEEMDMHKILVHDTNSDMCCPWCKNVKSMPKDELAKHLQNRHLSVYTKYFPRMDVLCRSEDDPLQCEHCQNFFVSIYDLADHIQEHEFDCPMCSMTFKTNSAYKSHLKRKHNQSLTSLKTNLTGNNDILPFNCSICKMQFSLEKYLKKHMNSKHKDSISNSQNDKSSAHELQFLYNSSVQHTHLEIKRLYETIESVNIADRPSSKAVEDKILNSNKINNEKKFICAYCPRVFKRAAYVKLHEQNIHRRETLTRKKCPICQKVLDARYLNIHITSMHNTDRKFDCDICGNSYKTYSRLSSHKYLHLNRKHLCTVCNKGFICASELKVHMRAHTGEEPYACHLCDERFKIKVRLTYHLQRHAGIKQKCHLCGKEFNRIEQLKSHSYQHTGMPYRCPVCEYKCVKRDKFRRHLLAVHKKSLTEDELSEMFKENTGRYARVRIVKDVEPFNEVLQEKDYSDMLLN